MYQSREYDRHLKHVGFVWWGSLTTLRWCGRIPTVRGTPRTMPNHDTMKGSTLRTICTQAGISRDAFPDVYDNCWQWGGIPAKHELSDDINRLPEKTRRIRKTALKRLEEDPFPGSQGEAEKLVLRGGGFICRLHISRRYTVFYEFGTEKKLGIVQEILPIGQDHKKYG